MGIIMILRDEVEQSMLFNKNKLHFNFYTENCVEF